MQTSCEFLDLREDLSEHPMPEVNYIVVGLYIYYQFKSHINTCRNIYITIILNVLNIFKVNEEGGRQNS